jgi:LAO/AO transport system kinase
VPGVGKSTFINVFTKYLLSKGHQVAILAVDPSSKQTGGSILGDKTRMEDIFAHPKVLIRPSPAGETLGGVSSRTRETILLLEAAGYDRILVETVGVGQSETAVHSMTDVFLLLMLPGAGDELQGIKRGIMEMADILVVHKADGSNQQKSELALSNYKRALHLFPPTESDWIPRVIAASSTEETGIDQVEEAIESYFLHIQSNGFLDYQRKQQLSEWFQTSLELQLLAHIRNDAQLKSQFQALQDDVLQQKTTPYKAAEQIIRSILKS